MRWFIALLIVLTPGLVLAEIGQIKLALGAASIERAGKLIPAKAGQLIEAADVIVTGKDGRMGYHLHRQQPLCRRAQQPN